MARKKRKLPVGKKRRKSRVPLKKRSRRSLRARTQKQRPHKVMDRVKSAYRAVADTIKGTDQLRNKMEPPATSETE